ncbi:MAG: abortive infection family protein [Maricaulaceae bacterium]|nr:abortive infection family protein [Maricaulaceae bacterium]
MCRSILIELGEPLPAKKDVQGLFNAVKGPLGLSPDRSDLDPLIAGDVRTTLGGLATVIQGVGALRTHAGDAHGRERGYARVDARIGRLSIHAASTVALFLIETWQRKFPTRILHRHDESV